MSWVDKLSSTIEFLLPFYIFKIAPDTNLYYMGTSTAT